MGRPRHASVAAVGASPAARPSPAQQSDFFVNNAARSSQSLSLAPHFRALVALGGNLGDVRSRLRSGVEAMANLPGTHLEGASSLYRTRPVDAAGPDFINAVVALDTALAPHELMRALLRIELEHDRSRPHVNAPRTLDLDLLHHGGAVLGTPVLTLPHPRQHGRAFVMLPLAELIGQLPARLDHQQPDLLSAQRRGELAAQQGIEVISGQNWLD
jgi:2-amino-4-hydroxy-6-hydroxymethyldihydropteridine diphosphokinase